jgi:hypothetical protein
MEQDHYHFLILLLEEFVIQLEIILTFLYGLLACKRVIGRYSSSPFIRSFVSRAFFAFFHLSPFEYLFATRPVKVVRDNFPGMKALLAVPIPRDSLAKVGVAAAIGDLPGKENGIFSIEDIQHEAR